METSGQSGCLHSSLMLLIVAFTGVFLALGGAARLSSTPPNTDLWWCTDVYDGHTTIAAGQTIHWTIGVGIGDDPERAPEARANTTAWLNVDGTPATFLGYWAYYEDADLYYSGLPGDPDEELGYGFHAVFEFGPLEPGEYVIEGGITTFGETFTGTCIAHAR
jgi:hypothetical protein